MERDDLGAYAILALGLGALWIVNRPKSKAKPKDRTGESCDPLSKPPNGYVCVTENGEFVLRKEEPKIVGFGPYPSQSAVDEVLNRLGMQSLSEFQTFMSQTTRHALRTDGVADINTMNALKEAEELLEAGKWHYNA